MDTSSAVHQWLKTRSHKVKKIPVITVIMIRTSRARGEWPFTLKKGSPHHSIAFLCVRVREEMIKLYLRLEGLRCYPSVQRLWKVTTRLDSRKNEYLVVWQKKWVSRSKWLNVVFVGAVQTSSVDCCFDYKPLLKSNWQILTIANNSAAFWLYLLFGMILVCFCPQTHWLTSPDKNKSPN